MRMRWSPLMRWHTDKVHLPGRSRKLIGNRNHHNFLRGSRVKCLIGITGLTHRRACRQDTLCAHRDSNTRQPLRWSSSITLAGNTGLSLYKRVGPIYCAICYKIACRWPQGAVNNGLLSFMCKTYRNRWTTSVPTWDPALENTPADLALINGE